MQYHEPGNTNDLSEELRKKWIDQQSVFFDDGIDTAKREMSPPSQRSWFFNAIKDAVNEPAVADIRWNAFPKRLVDRFASKMAAWREGDRTRNNHEEYCEWEVVRDGNAVLKVTFTTEVPEYYSFLYQHDQKLLLDLYHKHVSTSVKIQDLEGLEDGQIGYSRTNIWNYPENQGKRGVLMHMGFGPNTLNAAIALSAEATWPSVDNQGNIITDEQGLIDCRGYGARERHSDPHIGAQINSLVRAGHEVSFGGPAGLYIDAIDLSDFEVPNGVQATDLFRVIRGDKDHMMRVVFEAPKDSGFNLSDVRIGGNKINFGGQIAEKITIRVRGIARKADKVPPSINCGGQSASGGLESLEISSPSKSRMRSSRRQHVEFLDSME